MLSRLWLVLLWTLAAAPLPAAAWDTGTWDTGTWETGTWETGTWETGTRETGTRETGTRETGTRETGTPDGATAAPIAATALPAAGTDDGGSSDERTRPTIEADEHGRPHDLRAAERVELVPDLSRELAAGGARVRLARSRRANLPELAAPSVGGGWCDPVQCRRQCGEQLLGYATPPPGG